MITPKVNDHVNVLQNNEFFPNVSVTGIDRYGFYWITNEKNSVIGYTRYEPDNEFVTWHIIEQCPLNAEKEMVVVRLLRWIVCAVTKGFKWALRIIGVKP